MSLSLDDPRVAVVAESPRYCDAPPFHPSEAYPESSCLPIGNQDNPAYRGIRLLFHHLDLDRERFNTPQWNPLGEFIRPGNVVLLKPNLVSDRNKGEKAYGLTDTDCLVTHGSLIRAVLDYVAKGLQGRGKILIGDCPVQGTDWRRVLELIGFEQVREFFHQQYPKVELQIRDYRLGRAITKGRTFERIVDESHRSEYVEVDLEERSLLVPLMQGPYAFGVSHYSTRRMRHAHSARTNKYLIHRDFLHADVVINVPKMKSHMKAGITCGMKNFVGIVGHKDYLPHFRFGSPRQGGDEYPDGNWLWNFRWRLVHADWERDRGILKQVCASAARVCHLMLQAAGTSRHWAASVIGGGWQGNDTLWRTVLDINRAFFYFDREEQVVTSECSPKAKYMVILDGLVGGEKESPLAPSPIKSGFMLAAFNPLALDGVATALMGFDVNRVKQISEGFKLADLPLARFALADIVLCTDLPARRIVDVYKNKLHATFEPSMGYKGGIEYRADLHADGPGDDNVHEIGGSSETCSSPRHQSVRAI